MKDNTSKNIKENGKLFINWIEKYFNEMDEYPVLPNVKPVFQWIRLAQRIPIRVELEDLNQSDVVLRYGMSASVLIRISL